MDNTPLEEIVRQIGVKLRRSPSEIEPVLQKLRDNWVSSLWIWSKLSDEKKANLQLPAALEMELNALQPSKHEDVCWIMANPSFFSLLKGGRVRYEIRYTEKLQTLLDMMGAQALVSVDGETYAPCTELSLCVFPGTRLLIGETSYTIRVGAPGPTFAWLDSLGLSQYVGVFAKEGLDDFLALPFLSEHVLRSIGIADDKHVAKMLSAVRDLRAMAPVPFLGTLMKFTGCDQAIIESFSARKIDLQAICELPMDKLCPAGTPSLVQEIVELYKGFSSVQETFVWLQYHGFEKYAFHFARYNIPFYALPCVNFFIIDEMGVTHDDQLLLQALQSLKNCKTFDVRAVAFWLRDLELEKYNTAFASAGYLTLDSIIQMTDAQAEALVDSPSDRHKLKTGIQEMQEFQFYYFATASLLQELGMERYSQLFALHGISIDVLPFLTERQLTEMGIAKKNDRKKILAAIEKIKQELPRHVGAWGDQAKDFGAGPMAPGGGGMRRNGLGMRGGMSKQQQLQLQQQQFEEKTVDELMSFISGDTGAAANANNNNNGNNPSRAAAASKKARKKKNRKARANASAASSPSKGATPPPSSAKKSDSAEEEQDEDEVEDEAKDELDPVLKVPRLTVKSTSLDVDWRLLDRAPRQS